VPVYTETIDELPAGLQITGWQDTDGVGDDAYGSININDTDITLNTDTDAYTVTAKINNHIYSGSWTAATDQGHAYGGYTWIIPELDADQTCEFYLENIGSGDYNTHIYLNNRVNCSDVEWLIITPNNAGDVIENYRDEGIFNYNCSWSYGRQGGTSVHQLPAQYVPIDNDTIINDNGVLKAAGGGGSDNNALYRITEVSLPSVSQTFTSHRTQDSVLEVSYIPSGHPFGDIFTFYNAGDAFNVDYVLNDGTTGTVTLYYTPKIGISTSAYSTTSYNDVWIIEEFKDSVSIPYNDISQMSNKFLGLFSYASNGTGAYAYLAKPSSGNYVVSVSCGDRTLHKVRLTIPVKGGIKSTDSVLYSSTLNSAGGIYLNESTSGGNSTYNISIQPNTGIIPTYLNGNGVRTSFGGGLIAGYNIGVESPTVTLSNNNITASVVFRNTMSGKYLMYIGITPSTYTGDLWNACIIREIIIDFTNATIEGAEQFIESYSFNNTRSFTLNTRADWKFTKQISLTSSSGNGWKCFKENSYPLDWSNKFESRYIPIDDNTIKRDNNGNIKTAIPVPPTTDGTYTLQVVVSDGVPTYSWV